MHFKTKLIQGTLIRRYKRFLADVKLSDGNTVTAHCTNSGSMLSCIAEGAEVYLSPVSDPKRKTSYTWEMIKLDGNWVGINTLLPNQLAYEALMNDEIEGLKGYTKVKREVKWEDSRFDLMALNEQETCFIEVKNVSLKLDQSACFPDAVTIRGRKHLETLIRVKEQGMRAVMLYVIQRADVSYFAPADSIDPEYGKALRKAHHKGVEIFAVQTIVTPFEIKITKILPVKL